MTSRPFAWRYKHWRMSILKRLLIFLCLVLIQACSKEHEIVISSENNPWSKEFRASSVPFSESSLIVQLNGTIEGLAQISVYPSSEHTESMRTELIGPGSFEFQVNESEYWQKTVYIKYVPQNSAVANINGFVIFGGN